MATYRIGIGSFNLKDGNIGIGTETAGFGNLKVEGTIKTSDLDVGISTFTRYSGFEGEQTNIVRDTSYGGNQSVTYAVTVIGGIFYIDGVSAPILTLKRGTTYTFDQSSDTNNGHPLRFKDGDGNPYTTGVTDTGTAGSLEAKVTLIVASDAPDDLRYYCTVHGNGMGNTISVINRTSSNLETTGDIVVDTGNTLTVGSGATISVGSVECISVKHHFSVPVGDTAGRDKSSGYAEGTVRYNRDLGTMEFFNGNEWRQFTYISDIQNSPSTMGRAVLLGGSNPETDIKFFQIMTLGNSESFGDLIENHQYGASSGSNTRGIVAGGYSAPDSNYSQPRIEYITMASKGDGITFGELSSSHFRNSGGASSSTRGMFFGGGYPSYYNSIEYVELDTLGNALDFGDLLSQKMILRCTSSPTRAFARGGYHPSNDSKISSQIDMVTIASKGNAIRFGDPTQRTYGMAACANNIRAIYAGGYSNHPDSGVISQSKTIEYFTMASEGNATVFGDLIIGSDNPAGNSNQVRGVISGGYKSPTGTNRMEFVTIASTGNAQDFGDLSSTDWRSQGTSDSHGGLGGY